MSRKIKVGDIVEVVDWGCEYATDFTWFHDHKNELEFEWLVKYSYGNYANFIDHQYDDDNSYRVLYIDERRRKCLITLENDYIKLYTVYLIDLEGIKLNNKTKMTIAEIEKKLGIHNLEIIEED